jgi:hypothetical protein
MTQAFTVPPAEVAYDRRVLFAVQLVDPVTLSLVSEGMKVIVGGMRHAPIVSASGSFVWLEEAGAAPGLVRVHPGDLPYEEEQAPAPILPSRLRRITLRPRMGYVFPDGVTAIRSALYETLADPLVPVVGETVRLQWLDDSQVPAVWVDAGTATRTDRGGGFVCFLRLLPTLVPAVVVATGFIRLTLSVGPDAGPRHNSNEWSMPQGRTSDLSAFLKDDLHP